MIISTLLKNIHIDSIYVDWHGSSFYLFYSSLYRAIHIKNLYSFETAIAAICKVLHSWSVSFLNPSGKTVAWNDCTQTFYNVAVQLSDCSVYSCVVGECLAIFSHYKDKNRGHLLNICIVDEISSCCKLPKISEAAV